MVRGRYFFVGGSIVIIGIVLAVAVFPSEEKRVKNRFRLLSEWVSKSTEENPITMLQKAKDIGTLFLEPSELKASGDLPSGSFTRQEISAYAGRARLHFSEIDLKFYDLHVFFPEKEVAQVTLTARLIGKLKTGEQADEIHELDCLMKKVDNKWFFSQIEVNEVLKK